MNWFDGKNFAWQWIFRFSTLWTYSMYKCRKKSSLTEIFFRQINYLVISLVSTLVSRNFCQNIVRVKWKCHNSATLVAKIPWNQLFTKMCFAISWFDEKNWCVTVFLIHTCTMEFSLPRKKIVKTTYSVTWV